jgi:hypothetical protein
MAQLNFFSQVDPEKRVSVLDFLQKSGGDLRIKIRDQNYRSKILNKKGDGLYSIYKFIPGNFQDQEATFSFDAEDGKFFFRGSISTVGSDLIVNIPTEIFQLVRRSDFRVDLPPKNGYPCAIMSVNGKKKATPIPAELRNISLGGCQIWVQTSDISPNKEDEISLNLTIKDFEWEHIKGIAKQIRPANEKGDLTVLGLQFKDPDAEFLTEVQSALMYLDRMHRHKH